MSEHSVSARNGKKNPKRVFEMIICFLIQLGGSTGALVPDEM